MRDARRGGSVKDHPLLARPRQSSAATQCALPVSNLGDRWQESFRPGNAAAAPRVRRPLPGAIVQATLVRLPTMWVRDHRRPREAGEAARCRHPALPQLLRHRALAEPHGTDFERAGEGGPEGWRPGRWHAAVVPKRSTPLVARGRWRARWV
jgi:hypothetical protein